jgi:hypothetical protein
VITDVDVRVVRVRQRVVEALEREKKDMKAPWRGGGGNGTWGSVPIKPY